MAGFGHSNAISPKALAAMHPALIGGGERAAAGLPPNSMGNNMLAAAGNPTGHITNGLLGQFSRSPDTGPSPQQVRAPPQTVTPSVPAPPAGQQRAAAILQALAPDKMSNADLSANADRYEYMLNTLGRLLASPKLDHSHVLQAITEAVKDGAMPAGEAGAIIGRVTTDPTKLRSEMADRYLLTIGSLVHLAAEKQKRGAK